jgi:hypothetical protein
MALILNLYNLKSRLHTYWYEAGISSCPYYTHTGMRLALAHVPTMQVLVLDLYCLRSCSGSFIYGPVLLVLGG